MAAMSVKGPPHCGQCAMIPPDDGFLFEEYDAEWWGRPLVLVLPCGQYSIVMYCVPLFCWVVEKHGDFQLVYYGAHVDANSHKRDAYKSHAYFKTAGHSTSAGTSPVSILPTTTCHSISSARWSEMSLPAPPMTPT